MPFYPPHVLIDDFLPLELHDALLEHALRQEEKFCRATIRRSGTNVHGDTRRAMTNDNLGSLELPMRQAVLRATPILFERLGMKAFDPARIELEMSAHRNGDYFAPHRDTFFRAASQNLSTERVITAVYYFHTPQRRFTGGEFAIHPHGAGEPQLFEPKDNRLLAIPAFALHEVCKICCTSDEFSASRFAVNAWIHRRKNDPASGGD